MGGQQQQHGEGGPEALALDRPGIFKARPIEWAVQTSNDSKSIGVSVLFLIEGELQGDEFVSWKDFDPFTIRGWWYPIGRDGQVNENGLKQLVEVLGWDADLNSIVRTQATPPDRVVQIVVKEEVYKGTPKLKVKWMNPEDYIPEPFEASPEEVKGLSGTFNSMLRAAASGLKRAGAAAALPPKGGTPPAAAAQKPTPPPPGRRSPPARGAATPPAEGTAPTPPLGGRNLSLIEEAFAEDAAMKAGLVDDAEFDAQIPF